MPKRWCLHLKLKVISRRMGVCCITVQKLSNTLRTVYLNKFLKKLIYWPQSVPKKIFPSLETDWTAWKENRKSELNPALVKKKSNLHNCVVCSLDHKRLPPRGCISCKTITTTILNISCHATLVNECGVSGKSRVTHSTQLIIIIER